MVNILVYNLKVNKLYSILRQISYYKDVNIYHSFDNIDTTSSNLIKFIKIDKLNENTILNVVNDNDIQWIICNLLFVNNPKDNDAIINKCKIIAIANNTSETYMNDLITELNTTRQNIYTHTYTPPQTIQNVPPNTIQDVPPQTIQNTLQFIEYKQSHEHMKNIIKYHNIFNGDITQYLDKKYCQLDLKQAIHKTFMNIFIYNYTVSLDKLYAILEEIKKYAIPVNIYYSDNIDIDIDISKFIQINFIKIKQLDINEILLFINGSDIDYIISNNLSFNSIQLSEIKNRCKIITINDENFIGFTNLTNYTNFVADLAVISKNSIKYLIVIACHCNTELKLTTFKNNLSYLNYPLIDIIVINSYNLPYNSEIKKLCSIHQNITYLECENDATYDFGKWVYGLNNVNYNNYKYTIFTNDSYIIHSPINHFFELSYKSDVELYGYNDSSQIKYHYQSYLFALKNEAIPQFIHKYNEKKHMMNNQWDVIINYELQMCDWFSSHKCFLNIANTINKNKNIFMHNFKLYAIFKECKLLPFTKLKGYTNL